MTIATPPIVRLAERLLVDVELAVSKWPRAHRYLSGADLRRAAMRVAKRSQRAWRAKADKAERVERLADAVATLKICLQVGMRIKAFRSLPSLRRLRALHRILAARSAAGSDTFSTPMARIAALMRPASVPRH